MQSLLQFNRLSWGVVGRGGGGGCCLKLVGELVGSFPFDKVIVVIGKWQMANGKDINGLHLEKKIHIYFLYIIK